MKSHLLSLAVRTELFRQLSGHISDFREVKLQQSDIRDPLSLLSAPSKSQRAWMILGSDKERPAWLRAFAGWTTEGIAYSKLPFTWLGDMPRPASGCFDALDVTQYHAMPGPFDGVSAMHFELEPPSSERQELVAREYLESVAFQSWLDRVMPIEERKNVPSTRAEVAMESGKAERIFMRQWAHLLDRKPEAALSLEPYLKKPVSDLVALVKTHLVPTLTLLLTKR